MPNIWKTIKKSFIDSYDYLGLTILSSSVTTGIALIFLSLMGLIGFARHPLAALVGAIIIYIFVIAPVIAGTCFQARKIITHDEPAPRELFAGIRQYLAGTWLLGLVQVLITLALLVNIWFYFTHGGPIFQIIGVVFIYLLAFWLSSAMYHFPILVEQKPGTFTIIKRGFLLVLDNFIFTGAVFFAIILLACLCLATIAGIVLILPGLMSMITTRAFRAMLIKYKLLPPENEPFSGDNNDSVFKQNQ